MGCMKPDRNFQLPSQRSICTIGLMGTVYTSIAPWLDRNYSRYVQWLPLAATAVPWIYWLWAIERVAKAPGQSFNRTPKLVVWLERCCLIAGAFAVGFVVYASWWDLHVLGPMFGAGEGWWLPALVLGASLAGVIASLCLGFRLSMPSSRAYLRLLKGLMFSSWITVPAGLLFLTCPSGSALMPMLFFGLSVGCLLSFVALRSTAQEVGQYRTPDSES